VVRGDSGAGHGQRSGFFYQGGYCGRDLPSRAADILPVTSPSSGSTAFLPDCSYFDVCDIIARGRHVKLSVEDLRDSGIEAG
jgi:hypothetical protein